MRYSQDGTDHRNIHDGQIHGGTVAVAGLSSNVTVVCNEEGKLLGMEPGKAIQNVEGIFWHYIRYVLYLWLKGR